MIFWSIVCMDFGPTDWQCVNLHQMVYSLVQTLGEYFKACSFKKQKHNALYELSSILVNSFVVFLATKLPKYCVIVCLFFHFFLPILPCKRKTLRRKSRKLNDKKPSMKFPKYVMSRTIVTLLHNLEHHKWNNTIAKIRLVFQDIAARLLCCSAYVC